MEALTLAAVAALLAPYLHKAGEKVAEKTVEAVFDSRRDLAEKFAGLFKTEIISLGLNDAPSGEEVVKRLEARPDVVREAGRKVADHQDLLAEVVEAYRQMPGEEFRGVSINAKNIGAVINDPKAPVTLNNTFS